MIELSVRRASSVCLQESPWEGKHQLTARSEHILLLGEQHREKERAVADFITFILSVCYLSVVYQNQQTQ